MLLRKHRFECGSSQEALAEAAGISTSAVGAYERGVHGAPHRSTVRLLADALALTGVVRAEFEVSARRKPRSSDDTAPLTRGRPPLPVTSFIGRERELQQIRELLARHRVVTLTGSGGIGKTRLALRAASQLAATYRDVWFIDFSTIADEAHVASHVASTLGIPPPSSDAAFESLATQL